MPKFIAILKAQDGTDNYRRVAISAESKEEAKRFLENREYGYAMYRLDTQELADIGKREKALAEGKVLAPDDRAKLALHNQEKPYKLDSLTEEKGA